MHVKLAVRRNHKNTFELTLCEYMPERFWWFSDQQTTLLFNALQPHISLATFLQRLKVYPELMHVSYTS